MLTRTALLMLAAVVLHCAPVEVEGEPPPSRRFDGGTVRGDGGSFNCLDRCDAGSMCDVALNRCLLLDACTGFDAGCGVNSLCHTVRGAARCDCVAGAYPWQGTCSFPTWRQLPSGPAGRRLAAMAFDSRRGRVVLFGGETAASTDAGERLRVVDDTWEWDGVRWQQLDGGTPGLRLLPMMAYDEARGETVLFGGGNGLGLLADTWAWNGSVWRRASTTGPARPAGGLTYDPIGKRLVLFGGAPTADTWVWDGTTWSELTSAGGPPPRDLVGLGTDFSTGEVMLTGGSYSLSVLTDSWRLRDGAWSSWPSAIKPFNPGAVVWSTGGFLSFIEPVGPVPNEVGVLTRVGDAWFRQLPPRGPPARLHAAVSSSPDGGVMLMGGLTVSGVALDDVWQLGF